MPSQDARTADEAKDTVTAAPQEKHAALLKDLQKQVALLEDDLRERARGGSEQAAALKAEYDRALLSDRTSVPFGTWLEERVVQIAAAWVLGCVFVRFCEDNGLVAEARLSGPGERLAEAQDNHDEFFRLNPELNDRDWLKESFRALGREHEITEGLFDPAHNPLWELDPSYSAASRLLSFWRERGADGRIRHDFTDATLNTRFLGDLYQDLSEHARKTYALLQTPEFVEEFILDLTLEPALEEFGLDPAWKHVPEDWRGEASEEIDENGRLTKVVRGLRCIDPACGSGHFLLGLFRRVLAAWREAEPGAENWTLVRRALESVHGADKNPFAVSIARFRLLVDTLKECNVSRLSAAPRMPIRIAVADSLLHGRDAGREIDPTFDDVERGEAFTYRTEDIAQYVKEVDLLGRGSYHVVVANPPYITVKDKAENEAYRRVYWACSGKYALSVPFAQRIFELAVRAGGDRREGGFTGQITANSFMKREFGATLIESFFHGGPYKDPQTRRRRDFPGVELTHVLDTSGAYIPGHGTPTVILAGRNQGPRQSLPVRAVLGVRGEPGPPPKGREAQGKVWQAIVSQWRKPGAGPEEWVTVEDVDRQRLAAHPWSLSGGGAGPLMKAVEAAAVNKLSDVTTSIGISAVTGEDDLYLMPRNGAAKRLGVAATRQMVTGDVIRDFVLKPDFDAIWMYDKAFKTLPQDAIGTSQRVLEPYRTAISSRKRFGVLMLERGMAWYEWQELYPNKLRTPLTITYGEVATHNHFVLDRGGKVFNRTAPVIKMAESASEEQHLGLLGVLNSSMACFWMKQVSHLKGGSGIGRGVQDESWENRYAFNGTRLQEFPLSAKLPVNLARQIDGLAQELATHEPTALTCSSASPPTADALEAAEAAQKRIRARMILLQEELDWTVYGLYRLLTPADVARTTLPGDLAALTDADMPELALGQRAFEIALARSGADTAWFDRHGSEPVLEIRPDWPESYRQIVQARLDVIASNKDIRLIERPEYKRRWSTKPWKDREAAALRSWLLDAMEREELWFEEREGIDSPRPLTIYQLADALRHDQAVQDIAKLYAERHLDKRDVPLSTILAAVIEPEHVPYLAALRYKESGLRKRAEWEHVWEEQRKEDQDGERRDIKVPPKYTSADFLKHSYWSNRGKLDVPKERFVSYPGASPDNDPSLLIGWAGWNHRHQAEALVNLLNDRLNVDGWHKEDPRFVPLLAGLAEVMPWVKQWHDAYDAEWEGNPAEEFNSALVAGLRGRDLSDDDLVAWRPEKRGRAAAK
ncbi:BREX-2 system adenine-specific DNA-methyltransferase PglX [Streptomyces lavendulocolor]|uniref:BREX-2 system adenine-specific DNA-methyltransferase PglX n=1 Tax=Streptomyces lavendulocolor TaxID=67316 RepID=UPI003C2B3007